jgi:hypothetical protein
LWPPLPLSSSRCIVLPSSVRRATSACHWPSHVALPLPQPHQVALLSSLLPPLLPSSPSTSAKRQAAREGSSVDLLEEGVQARVSYHEFHRRAHPPPRRTPSQGTAVDLVAASRLRSCWVLFSPIFYFLSPHNIYSEFGHRYITSHVCGIILGSSEDFNIGLEGFDP